jgi:hypothetical protein
MTTTQISKKSGKGVQDEQVSELTAIFHVKPGHAGQLRVAVQRFGHATDGVDLAQRMKVGLRFLRLVLFDNDERFLWATSFETDWDAYVDDAVATVHQDVYVDMMQHLVEYPYPEGRTVSSAEIKKLLQDNQARADWFHDVFSSKTMPEILKAAQVEQVFAQVLDNPDAAQALQHPALKPLLALAAS